MDGMQRNKGFGVFGDNFAQGYQKQWFPNFQNFAQQTGSGIDTIPLLSERLDIRIKVEATLSNLFNRTISLEWDSGNLIPKAFLGTEGTAYRLDSEECHGIKELLVMLTHLYNDAYQYLIIDEPELNLHPQFQAFFMQEVRRVCGNPNVQPGKKGVVLITHSPFTLDFRGISDLQSVISFSIDHTLPRNMLSLDQRSLEDLNTLVSRINVNHKQFFFSDNPVFVEGVFDLQLVQAIQDARNFSISGAGSCIIDAGGCEEVNKYILLCNKLEKRAFFIYDLDSLFTGTLRGCIRNDDEVTSFLASLGLGADFSRYCGELDRLLTSRIREFAEKLAAFEATGRVSPSLKVLSEYVTKLPMTNGLHAEQSLQRARTAFLVQIGLDRSSLEAVFSKHELDDIQGRLQQVASALAQKNVLLLTKGALENYCPSYVGNPFHIEDGQKRLTVEKEVLYLSTKPGEDEIAQRYGGLFDCVSKLPAKPEVDLDQALIPVLGQLILDFQYLTLKKPRWELQQMRNHLFQTGTGRGRIFEVAEFARGAGDEFTAKILVKTIAPVTVRHTVISHRTNAGMRDFELKDG